MRSEGTEAQKNAERVDRTWSACLELGRLLGGARYNAHKKRVKSGLGPRRQPGRAERHHSVANATPEPLAGSCYPALKSRATVRASLRDAQAVRPRRVDDAPMLAPPFNLPGFEKPGYRQSVATRRPGSAAASRRTHASPPFKLPGLEKPGYRQSRGT